MAESTLSLTYDEIQVEVGRYLGYDILAAGWAVANPTLVAEIDRVIQAGYRQFLYPPSIAGVEAGYEWSFLKPTTTITTIAPYDTGTVEVATTTCTLTGGTWPSWAATDGTLVIDGTEYTVVSRDSDTELTVSAEGDIAAGESDWTLTHSGIIDLPDDFGRIIGDLNFAAGVYRKSIPVVSEYQIQQLRQQSLNSGVPVYAAVRFRDDDGTGQRQEIVFWRVPNDAYVLTYRYEVFTGEIATGEYAVGGMKFSEVIVESCLAIAEQRINDEKGMHWDNFSRLLVSAIAQDSKNGARYFGPMSGGERGNYSRYDERYSGYGGYYPITYDGSTW